MNNINQIDIILPYVDCNDPEWQKLYYENKKKYVELDETWNDWATGLKRFRPNGMLKYVFRGIDKFAPWVRKVHMIVQSDLQVPDWINRDEVNIVYHEDFIPKEYLPTFNSSTIEMFLQNIEDLSECFIYGNDDTIFTSPVNITDFFIFKEKILSGKLCSNQKLVFGSKIRRKNPNWTGDILRESNHMLLGNSHVGAVCSIQHIYLPHKKSIIKEVFKKYSSKILKNISQFRNKNEHNQWLFAEYVYKYYKHKMYVNRKLSYFSTEINEISLPKILAKDFSKYKAICLNDHKDTTDEQINKILEKINNILPEKSKYELYVHESSSGLIENNNHIIYQNNYKSCLDDDSSTIEEDLDTNQQL